MKKIRVFFHPIDGSGSLTISWSSAPKGDAIEAQKGEGVGFFSDQGDLLGVIFDEVQSDHDHQTLVFAALSVEIQVKKGKVQHFIHPLKKTARPRKQRRTSKTQSV